MPDRIASMIAAKLYGDPERTTNIGTPAPIGWVINSADESYGLFPTELAAVEWLEDNTERYTITDASVQPVTVVNRWV